MCVYIIMRYIYATDQNGKLRSKCYQRFLPFESFSREFEYIHAIHSTIFRYFSILMWCAVCTPNPNYCSYMYGIVFNFETLFLSDSESLMDIFLPPNRQLNLFLSLRIQTSKGLPMNFCKWRKSFAFISLFCDQLNPTCITLHHVLDWHIDWWISDYMEIVANIECYAIK